MQYRQVNVGNITIGKNSPLVLIAGPCVIESREMAVSHAEKIKEIAGKNKIPFIFKASFDKANRTSIKSFRGPGAAEGLIILRDIREKLGVPVLSDIHNEDQVDIAREMVDIIQIPAFLCRQTDLLVKVARTGKPVNVKKGQFMSPWEIENVIDKIKSVGNENILLTERGTTFGYHMLVNDFRSIVIMSDTGYPVIYDATHSVQRPGGLGTVSGGDSRFVLPLAKAAIACGADALFLEVHEKPEEALSDGPNMVRLSELDNFIKEIKIIEKAVR